MPPTASNGTALEGVHASGNPDTPVEVVTDLLAKALVAKDAAAMRDLVQQAQEVIAGLDPYLEAVSSKPSQVLTAPMPGSRIAAQSCQLILWTLV